MVAKQRAFKDAMYAQVARLGKAVAAPKRLELLDLLCQGPRTVEALADQAELSVANASQHLHVLRRAGLLEAEKKGVHVEYRLAEDEVARFFVALRGLAERRLAEVEKVARKYFDDRDTMEAVPKEELVRRVRAGEVIVLDVRPREEFRSGHIPGAASIPLHELESRLRELPKRKAVVAYCRGPYCVMAAEAVAMLRRHGYTAHRLEQGVADWRARRWRIDAEGRR